MRVHAHRFTAVYSPSKGSRRLERLTLTEERTFTSVRLKVPFYDVDMLQVVWNGHYLKYFEEARQALFRERGVDLRQVLQERDYAFPVIRTTIKYVYPLRFNDEFICTVTLKEARIKVVLDFEIRLLNDNTLCAWGRSEQAALKFHGMEMLFKIPDDIREALEGNPKITFFKENPS